MPTNSNYLSIVGNFLFGKYVSGPGVGPGSNSFSASVLFFQVLNNDGNHRFLWASPEVGTPAGWAISLDADNVSLVARVGDAAPSTKLVTYDLTGVGVKTRLGRMILATLVVDGGFLRLFVNGDFVGQTAIDAGGVVPSPNGVVVGGNLDSIANIGGVNYHEGFIGDDGINGLFLGCQDAVDLTGAWLFPDTFSSTNLWSAKDAGTTTLLAKAVWPPRVGTENLILSGAEILALGYKNLAWYS